MRRLISLLGVMAMVGLMSGTASAQFEYGMNYFQFDNWDNGNGDGSGPAFQPGGWNATTDGGIWISTGGSTPVLNTQDLNFQLNYRSTPTSPWIAITGAYLLSNGVAKLDVTVGSGGYPGYWMGCDDATGWGNDNVNPSPYRMVSNGNGIYYLPGTLNSSYPDGEPTQVGMQFNLYAWTGDYSSYAAAAGAGAEVGVTGAFQVGETAYWIMPIPQTTFSNMPSLVLTTPGDANYDGRVDINDLTIVLAHYNQSRLGWAQGEFTGSGTVDINDLTIVLAHYNQSIGSSTAALAAVPEPSAIAITAAALLGLLTCCRPKRKVGPACRA